MTNKEKFTALLKEFGVGFYDNGGVVMCSEGTDKVAGYSGFYTNFKFDADGKFVKMEILE